MMNTKKNVRKMGTFWRRNSFRSVMALLIIFSVLLSGCGQNGQQAEPKKQNTKWTVGDFYIYDADGDLYNYPSNETISFYGNIEGIGNLYEENGGEENLKYFTRRGIGIDSIAKMKFDEYDLSGFYAALTAYPVIGSLDDNEKEIEAEFFEKYPNLNEAIKHTNEISGNLSLFISAYFQVNETGEVIQLALRESGQPVEINRSLDTYQILFYIRNDRVFEWSVSHSAGTT